MIPVFVIVAGTFLTAASAVLSSKIASTLKCLIACFIVLAPLYPTLRVELLNRTSLSSPILGAWYDVLLYSVLILFVLSRTKPRRLDGPTASALAIVLCGLLASLMSPDPVVAYYGFRMTYLPMVLFFVGRYGLFHAADLRAFGWLLCATSVTVSVLGLAFGFVWTDYWVRLLVLNSQARSWGAGALARVGVFRLTGPLLDPLSFGFTAVLGALLSFSWLIARTPSAHRPFRPVIRNVALMAAFLVCVAGTAMSLTRGSWALLIIGMFVLCISQIKRLPRTLLSIAGLTAIALLGTAIVAPGPITGALSAITRTLDKTKNEGNDQRNAMWQDTIEAFWRRPIGYGLGSVGHVGERFSADTEATGAPIITDGWYLKLLAEGGAPLFAAFVTFLAVTTATLFSRQTSGRFEAPPPMQAAIVAIFVGATFEAVVSNMWDIFYVGAILWFLTGLALRPSRPTARLYLRGEYFLTGDAIGIAGRPPIYQQPWFPASRSQG